MSDSATAQFTIVNDLGLHARAATKLVQLAAQVTPARSAVRTRVRRRTRRA